MVTPVVGSLLTHLKTFFGRRATKMEDAMILIIFEFIGRGSVSKTSAHQAAQEKESSYVWNVIF